MILAFWCVLLAGCLPLGCSYIAKYGAKYGAKGDAGRAAPGAASAGFDNRNPRAWLAAQTGMRARADAAQGNSFEAFPLFAAAVVIAVLQHVPIATVNGLAAVFIVARLAYIAAYVLDKPSLRSLLWALGFACCVGLFVFAASGSLR